MRRRESGEKESIPPTPCTSRNISKCLLSTAKRMEYHKNHLAAITQAL